MDALVCVWFVHLFRGERYSETVDEGFSRAGAVAFVTAYNEAHGVLQARAVPQDIRVSTDFQGHRGRQRKPFASIELGRV